MFSQEKAVGLIGVLVADGLLNFRLSQGGEHLVKILLTRAGHLGGFQVAESRQEATLRN